MHIVFTSGSKRYGTDQDVHRVEIYPKAEGGMGAVRLYNRHGSILHAHILQNFDSIIIEQPDLAPDLQPLLPPAQTPPSE